MSGVEFTHQDEVRHVDRSTSFFSHLRHERIDQRLVWLDTTTRQIVVRFPTVTIFNE